jgi:hypothetical protein
MRHMLQTLTQRLAELSEDYSIDRPAKIRKRDTAEQRGHCAA